MILRLLGLPHTVTDDAHSHCAFTAKVLKFPAMMARLPEYRIVHYGVEGAETAAHEHVVVMSRDEQNRLRGHDGSNPTAFVGNDANSGNPLYRTFNERLAKLLQECVADDDLILLPFGHGHTQAVAQFPASRLVESGIGYPTLGRAEWKVFESYAWLHWHQGRANRNGKNYEWVVPNYFDVDAWDIEPAPPMDTVVYLGRICDIKGLHTIRECAWLRPDLHFVICGQGDPKPYLGAPNLEYRPPISGRERSAYLGRARACIMPTNFTEPFGGVAVEAQLCGTPVLSTSFGAFTETIEDRVTGFRCHTLGDFMAALDLAPTLDRSYIRERAVSLYGFDAIAPRYDRVFRQIADLKGKGWYTLRSTFGPAVTTATVGSAWTRAQVEERTYHMRVDTRAHEAKKRAMFAQMLDITPASAKGRRVLDVGAGPESLLLDLHEAVGKSVALDPIRFGDEDERRYEQHGVGRSIMAAEHYVSDAEFDEVWCYNCLQHVQQPEAVLAMMKSAAPMVRIFEWCNIPTDTMHLHVITRPMIEAAFLGWTCKRMLSGTWNENGRRNDEFFAAIYVRKDDHGTHAPS